MADPYVHSVVVSDPIGLHARPIGQIVGAVKESGLEVSVRRSGGPEVSALSALRLLAMKVKVGETLELVINGTGPDEARNLAVSLENLINEA
jgi:phosphotransferase system HPr (HPr) family protein